MCLVGFWFPIDQNQIFNFVSWAATKSCVDERNGACANFILDFLDVKIHVEFLDLDCCFCLLVSYLIVVDAFIFWSVLGMLPPFQVANEGWGSPTKNVTKLVLTVAVGQLKLPRRSPMLRRMSPNFSRRYVRAHFSSQASSHNEFQ